MALALAMGGCNTASRSQPPAPFTLAPASSLSAPFPTARPVGSEPTIDLTTPAIADLALRYQPTVEMSVLDRFWPVSVAAVLHERGAYGDAVCLYSGGACVARPPTLSDLRPSDTGKAFLDFPPSLKDVSAQFAAFARGLGVPEQVIEAWPGDIPALHPYASASAQIYFYDAGKVSAGYYRGLRQSGLTALQYWFFYPFNYYPTFVNPFRMLTDPVGATYHRTSDYHEGDWEHVTVLVAGQGKTVTPQYLWMARHDKEGVLVPWGKVWLDHATHPIISPAFGGHPSYQRCGTHRRRRLAYLFADYVVCDPPLYTFSGATTPLVDLARVGWACWPGHFGKAGPGFIPSSNFDNPLGLYLVDGPHSPLHQAENVGVCPLRSTAAPGGNGAAGAPPASGTGPSSGSGSGLPTQTSPPTPASARPVGATTLHATRELLFTDASVDSDSRLILKAPENGTLPALPGPFDFIGNLINGNTVATVIREGDAITSTRGVVLLPVKITGLTKTGTYEGTVNLAPRGQPADPIPVKLQVTDAWWWAVAAILLGTALVLYPQVLLRRWRPEKALHQRKNDLLAKYRAAQDDFDLYFAHYPGKNTGPSTFNRPSDTDIAQYQHSIDEAIRSYAKSTWYFDTASDAYKKIDQSLRLAEEDAAFYGDTGGFGKSLVQLDTALSSLAKVLRLPAADVHASALFDGGLAVDREPALALVSGSVLKGAVLKVGAAKARAQQGDEATALIGQWLTMAERVKRYELWALALGELDRNDPPVIRPEDRDLLRVARAKTQQAKSELLDATDASTLATASNSLDIAYSGLASLGGTYGTWIPPVSLQQPAVAPAHAPGFSMQRAIALLSRRSPAPAPHTPTVPELIQSVASLTVTPAKAVTIHRTRRWIADASIILLTLVVSVIAALDTFYFGKTFGTLEDYLTTIFVGTAAQGLAKGLTGTLTQLRGSSVPPPVAADPKAAQAQP